ncbi:DUF1844 domain-containing protein [bacterium]|nr:DUF1844 domain-containing protein [bacterium]MBU1651841.1 DUF1844 domain-containing protein [bacterium]
MTENQAPDKNTILFMGLVTSFQQNALIGLGKMVDPISNETRVDLNIAASFIDMLDMLAVKTKGNTSVHESRVLEEICSHLKLNYVEETKKVRSEPKADDQADDKATSEPAADDSASDEKAEK